MRCLCRHDQAHHHGLWCDECGDFCSPPPQDVDETVGEPMPPVRRDGQRWRGRRKVMPCWDPALDEVDDEPSTAV